MPRHALWLICCILPLVGAGQSPKAVLAKVKRAYASAKTYEDSGSVTTVFTGFHTTKKPFTTIFVRPDLFRFEFTEKSHGRSDRYVVWNDGTGYKSWWSLKGQQESFAGPGMALAGPTGVSGGSAYFAPSLLMPSSGLGNALDQMTSLSIKPGRLQKRPCFVISGKDVVGGHMTIWIDKSSFLVIKRVDEHAITGSKVVSTTLYSPRVGHAISRSRFKF